MKFDLKRPCGECPFRNDRPGYLTKPRAREIARALDPRQMGGGRTFTCHKTTVSSGDEDGERVDGPNAQHCAGALIMLEKSGRLAHNQMLRFAMRFGDFNPDALDMSAPIHASAEAFVKAQPS